MFLLNNVLGADARIRNAAAIVIRANKKVPFQVLRSGSCPHGSSDGVPCYYEAGWLAPSVIPFPVPCLVLAMIPSPPLSLVLAKA
jgi:hypothetical protein